MKHALVLLFTLLSCSVFAGFYEETPDCTDGIVVYVGEDKYYIVETERGYSIVKTVFLGEEFREGERMRGELDNTDFSLNIINLKNRKEYSASVEAALLMKDEAFEWMGNHKKLRKADQTIFERYSKYEHYKESFRCCDGRVIYEGMNGYYIAETRTGFTIFRIETGVLSEGDKVRGQLNSFSFKWLVNVGRNTELRVYIERQFRTERAAYSWLFRHRYLQSVDQGKFEDDEQTSEK